MKRANYGTEPEFDEGILEEYRRASAEGFAQPPSASLRQPPKEEPFRWPGLDQRRDTVRLDREELLKVTNPNQGLDADDADTVIAGSKKSREKWVLDVAGGSLFLLPSTDVVVGRKPESIEGSKTLTVIDPGRTLSKSHARLVFNDGAWSVQDLGSTNGTAIHPDADNDPLNEVKLAPGATETVKDTFRLGTLKVRLRKLVQ